MADEHVDFLLIGGGLAAGACAAELRAQGADGSILLAGREPDPPYDRPPLSKEYLRGEVSREQALVRERAWYEQRDVDLRTQTNVLGLDLEQRTAKLQSKDEVSFDRALIATGATVNLLRIDGAQRDGIHYLRAFGNADGIREEAEGADRAVLVGGSYIACEVAASLTELGVPCTLVMMEGAPLARTFGDEVGSWFAELLRGRGVELVCGEQVQAFMGPEGDEQARVRGVRTDQGTEVEGDLVVVGSGVKPDTMLAKRAGLEIDDGIVCDAALRTSAEGMWAAGDCCSFVSRPLGDRRLRIEHWDVAKSQGEHAARAMLGAEASYDEIPYFWSDLADWASLEYVGHATDWEEVVWRGDREAGSFSCWYVRDGRLDAALSVGRSQDLPHARRLIAEGARRDDLARRLGDPSTALDELGA